MLLMYFRNDRKNEAANFFEMPAVYDKFELEFNWFSIKSYVDIVKFTVYLWCVEEILHKKRNLPTL